MTDFLDDLSEKLNEKSCKICIIGAGYVGIPLALGFSDISFKTIGFDIDSKKIETLNKGIDLTGEANNEQLSKNIKEGFLTFTSNPKEIKNADFVIICVPTPLDENKKPDLSFVENAGITVARNMKRGSTIILESTVFPGVTEDILLPLIERESGLIIGKDFSIGYSPERINPGDSQHDLKKNIKVVAGIDEKTTRVLDLLYNRIVDAGVFKAKNIRTAEAAKVIENIQRDLNIALMNELAIIFNKMDIDMMDILEAAKTKWNFHDYTPGLVGGHCIPVDPYYLVHKSKEIGYDPKVILAGREINDSIPHHVTDIILNKLGKNIEGKSVLLLGLTFKKNVKDTRNTPVMDIIKNLKENKATIKAYDPLLAESEIENEFGIEVFSDEKEYDCIITVTDHDIIIKDFPPERIKRMLKDQGIIVDIRRIFKRADLERIGLRYYTI